MWSFFSGAEPSMKKHKKKMSKMSSEIGAPSDYLKRQGAGKINRDATINPRNARTCVRCGQATTNGDGTGLCSRCKMLNDKRRNS